MDFCLMDTVNLILHDYREMKDYVLPFFITAMSGGQTLGEVQNSADNALRGYGLYSVFAGPELAGKHFRLFMETVGTDSGRRTQIIDSSEDAGKNKSDNRVEYFPQYQSGFLFYQNTAESHVHFILETGGKQYESGTVAIVFNKTKNERVMAEQELVQMVQTVYEEQPLLLLSVFQKAPLNVFIGENSRIKQSIDTMLALMERCIRVYNQQYSGIRKVLKFRLQSYQYVDRIDKLTGLTADTMSYMAQNPQYLVEMKKNRGIHYKGKTYLPEKTLVTRNIVDYGTYENCYILSFLKMLMQACENLKLHLKLAGEDALQRERRAKLKSQKSDFAVLARKYQSQMNQAEKHAKNAKRLFLMYQTAFKISDQKRVTTNITKPKVTAIFQQIPEYNVFYKEVFVPWFDFGINISDALIADVFDTFVTAISEPSTTYELYIVCKWIQYLEAIGYEFDTRQAKFAGVHEKASRYSDHAYEFVFTKSVKEQEDSLEMITLYYSSSVYVPTIKEDRTVELDPNNVDAFLYRNTRNSFVSREDKETNGKGGHYEPDFILKYQKGNVIRYMLADAKHKDFETVRKEDMPKLLYKYIDSIKTLRSSKLDVRMAGLCAVYNEHSYDLDGNLLDSEDYFEFNQNLDDEPFTKMMYMNVNEEKSFEQIFYEILIFMKTYHVQE